MDAASTGGAAFEQRPEGKWCPPRVRPVITGALQHPPTAPPDQLDDGGLEEPTLIGEAVPDALGPPGSLVAHDQHVIGELGQALGDRPPRPTIENVSPTAQASHLATLLDQLDVHHATVVGHDFGAPVTVLLAARRPDLVAAVSLLAGNTFPDTPIPFPLSLTTAPIIGGLFSRLLFSAPSLALMLRQGTGPGSAPPDADLYLGDRGQRRTIATIFSGALTRLAELYTPVAAALEDLDVPVLVGWGERDPFFPVEQGQRAAAVAGARLHVFEQAGHFLPHERPDEVAHEIAALATAVSR